jgi:transcriptional regulator with XRE-family HTH domain
VPAADRARVGAELRRAREGLGLSGTQVAKQLGWSQSKVSRVETGRFGASVSEVAQLLDLYGLPHEVRAELLSSVARRQGLEGAWVVRAGGSGRRQAEVGALESRVRTIRQYQALWIPGLLQTSAYIAAVAAAAQLKERDDVVERRLQRQDALRKAVRSRYLALIEEEALYRRPGAISANAMQNQLQHLLRAAQDGFVDLRVRLAQRASTFVAGSFVHYQFKDGPSVVLVEAERADLYLSAPEDVERHERLFTDLREEALDEPASREAIERARRDLAAPRH